MKYPINFLNDNEIKNLFTYQTKMGMAPKFGSRSISWYQIHQMQVYDAILSVMKQHNLTESKVITKIDRYGFSRLYFKTDKGLIMGPSINWLYEQGDKRN